MITGIFLGGNVALSTRGLSLNASVALQDDALGSVGQRNIPISDPAVLAQVEAFVSQMLPALSNTAGFAISLPTPEPVEREIR